jgi:hypothetical protein
MLVPFLFFFFKRVFPRWQTKLLHFSIEILLGERIFVAPGGRRKMNKKGKKKGAALLVLFLSKVSHLLFFPSSECPKEKKRPTFSDLGSPCDVLGYHTPYGKKKGSIHIVCYFLFFLFRSYPFGGNASFDKREKRDGGVV